MASEKFSKGQAWFCTTGLPSDIIVEVDDMIFHLHKFPLMSKSRRLHQLIADQEANPTSKTSLHQKELQEEEDDGDEIEEVHSHITLHDFPGGSETFEMAAKFCYGVKIDLSAWNAAPLRCAAEFLEMTDEYSEENLIARTEKFISQSVLKSLKDSVRALKSCERVMELAETLMIPQRCIEAVILKASDVDSSLFGWPVKDGARQGRDSVNRLLWDAIEGGNRWKGVSKDGNFSPWPEDLALLNLNMFKRLISAMRDGDLSSEIVEKCLMHYAKMYIPGASRSSRKPSPTVSSSSSSSSVLSEREQRELLETITSVLSEGKSSRSTTGVPFLFRLLRTSYILSASDECRSVLEKRIGLQLEQTTLDDLLIPSYSYLNETLYDVDCVERILSHFLENLKEKGEEVDVGERSPVLLLVGKLIDGYLSEIASDANLKPERIYKLAMSLPEHARLFDDGLYRAVDVYLKAHPWISDSDREYICGMIDCQKLTLEACTHAAQNERLPLRAVVQVLLFEQLQLRHAIAGTLLAAETAAEPRLPSGSAEAVVGVEETDQDEDDTGEPTLATDAPAAAGLGSVRATWKAAVRENQVLRLDMDSMRTRVYQLERECSTMRKVIEKIDREGPLPGGGGWRGSLSRRFGCKFKTQVCHSHEPVAVEARKGRRSRGPSRARS
ncbi:hypothetical protein SAY87_017185 [Trapa incisa]|uniref:Phototropic-responsive NPH3 family protein n=1 Tax=Trapa incisa TaxID=236973 RepID=A0AAN7LBG0_9MYRT|nr:hypothetical protein SAY87_017185 [Trapa incisa]